MIIQCAYDSTNDRLKLQYDAEAQRAFAKACPAVDTVCNDPEILKMTGESSKVIQTRLSVGRNLLGRLAKDSARQIDVAETDLRATLELTLFAADFQIQSGETVSTLSQVIMLLAMATPYSIPAVALPPAAEVFNRSEVSTIAWESFDLIRRWEGTGPPRLALMQLYEVWMALNRIQPTNSQLRCLLGVLDFVTRKFRATMQTQATAFVAKPPKKRRPGRKS